MNVPNLICTVAQSISVAFGTYTAFGEMKYAAFAFSVTMMLFVLRTMK